MPPPRHELRRAVGASLVASMLLGVASVSAADTVALFVADERALYRQDVRPGEPIEEPTFLDSLSVTDGLPYRLTPDARTIVYADSSDGTNFIYSRPSDGSGEPTLLSSDQDEGAHLPYCDIFSPDGARVFFLQEVSGYFRAFVAAVDGSGDPVLVSSAAPSVEASSPFFQSPVCPSFFTPNGSHVLFLETDGAHERLYSRASDGSGDPVLLSNEGDLFGDVRNDVATSPDGTRVAYRIQEGALVRLYSRAIDGSGTPRLLSDEAPGGVTTVKRGPLYGPNSEYVVFIEESGGVDQLFSRRDAAGWTPQLFSPPAENARVPLEGSPISEIQEAVVFTAGGQLYQQALGASEGDPLVQLSRGDPWRVLSWGAPLSPDGETAIYRADENLGDDQVFSVAVAGGEDPVLLSGAEPGRDAELLGWNDISPDSVTAVFQQKYSPTTRQLFVRPLDGSWEEPRLVSNADPQPFGTGEQTYLGEDLAWSPDGQYLAFTECDYAAGDPENCLAFVEPWFEAWIATADGEGPSLLSSSDPTGDASYPTLVPEPGLAWATLAALASVLAVHRTRKR